MCCATYKGNCTFSSIEKWLKMPCKHAMTPEIQIANGIAYLFRFFIIFQWIDQMRWSLWWWFIFVHFLLWFASTYFVLWSSFGRMCRKMTFLSKKTDFYSNKTKRRHFRVIFRHIIHWLFFPPVVINVINRNSVNFILSFNRSLWNLDLWNI